MLILNRRIGEAIRIGDDIWVYVVAQHDEASLEIVGPTEVRVAFKEIGEPDNNENK